MNIIQAQNYFVKQVLPYFKEWGFVYIDAYSQFRKTDQDGFQNVILSLSKYEQEIWIEITFGIRKHQIEELAQQFLTNLSDFQNQATTISISLGKLNQNPYFRYKAENKEDLELCAEQFIEFMETQGMTFLEQSNSLQELDLVFNHKPHQPVLYIHNQTHRFFKGLIVARLTHHPRFDNLVETYYQKLVDQKTDATTIDKFKRLIGFLSHYFVN